jgi:hypothetical protein
MHSFASCTCIAVPSAGKIASDLDATSLAKAKPLTPPKENAHR